MSFAAWLSRVALVLAWVVVVQPAWGQSAKKPPAKKLPQLSEELKQFDANGDGKLDANERKAAVAAKRNGATAKAKAAAAAAAAATPAAAANSPAIDEAEMAKRFDFNGDGQLDESENQALQTELANLRNQAGGAGAPGGVPPGGPPSGTGSPSGSGRRPSFGGPGGPGGFGGDRQARYQEMIKKYDTNGDGNLDDNERAAMDANNEKLRGEVMKKYDTNGDGNLDDNERQARDASRLQQYDTNGDGQLDENERAAMPDYERVRTRRRGGFGGPGGFAGGFGGPGGFRGFGGNGPLPDFLKQYDTNGDGQLNEQEQSAMQTAMRAESEKRRAEQMKKYDANGNGQLDEKEQLAMRADYDKLRSEMMQKYDTNHDNQLSTEERTARDASRLKEYDKNADGKLDESETAAMPEFERMRGGSGFGFGGPGGGFGGSSSYARADASRGAQLPGNVKKYDTNRDGKLDAAERKAMQSDQQKPKKPSGTSRTPSASGVQAAQ